MKSMAMSADNSYLAKSINLPSRIKGLLYNGKLKKNILLYIIISRIFFEKTKFKTYMSKGNGRSRRSRRSKRSRRSSRRKRLCIIISKVFFWKN
jgi:hypothetical protein